MSCPLAGSQMSSLTQSDPAVAEHHLRHHCRLQPTRYSRTCYVNIHPKKCRVIMEDQGLNGIQWSLSTFFQIDMCNTSSLAPKAAQESLVCHLSTVALYFRGSSEWACRGVSSDSFLQPFSSSLQKCHPSHVDAAYMQKKCWKEPICLLDNNSYDGFL